MSVAYSVTVQAPGSGTPTGNVVVTDADSAATCTATVAAGSCSLTFTAAGTHHLRATYQGDANYQASAPSAAADHTVNAASTATTVTGDTPDPSLTGQAFTVSYSVAATAPGAGTPTGNVFVTDDDSLAVCTASVAAGSCQLTISSAGTHHLHATYLGDANFLASGASAAALHTVNPAAPAPTVISITPADATPTNAASVHWTVTFSTSVSGVDAGDFQLVNSGLTGSPAITSVSAGPASTYTVTASTGSGTGTLGLNLNDNDTIVDGSSTPLGGAGTGTVGSGGTGDASTAGAAYSIDHTAPSVTINQSVGQVDPTNVSPVSFTVVFSEPVTDFAAGDVTLTGSATHGVPVVTGSGTTYTVAVPVTSAGTVTATVAAGTAHDAVGNANTASTSTDNTVTFTTASALTVTVNQAAAQADPTSTSPVSFTVVFSSSVTDFTAGDVTLGGTATHGAASVTGSGTTYTVTVPVTTSGTVTASLGSGVAHDAFSTPNAPSTSADNTVTFDNVRPSVTVNQAAAQADPTSTSPVSFTVVFSESVADFTAADVTLGGTATHGAATVTGSGTTYTVSVPVTTSGTVTASLIANVAHDTAGNGSTASTSTDNSVTFNPVVALTVTGVNPSSRGQGAAGQSLTITGTGFGGANGTFAGTVAFSGTGITVNSVTKSSATQLTANVTLSATAATGSRNVTVTNPSAGGSATCNGCFSVTARPNPTSTSPSSRGRGATNQNVNVNGSNFQAGATVAFSGTGITVNSVNRTSSSLLVVNLSISGSAATGSRNVTVTNPDGGVGTLTNGFTVNSGLTLGAMTPSALPQGATSQTIMVPGTGFASDLTFNGTVSVSGTGVTVNWWWRDLSTRLWFNVTVDNTAPVGPATSR